MLRICVTTRGERREITHDAGPLEFGRAHSSDGVPRCVVDDQYVSRNQLRLEEREAGRVHVVNLSRRNRISLPDGSDIGSGEERVLTVPASLRVGETIIDVQGPDLPVPPPPPRREHPSTLTDLTAPRKFGLFGDVEEPSAGQLATIDRPIRPTLGQRIPERTLAGFRKDLSPNRLLQWFETLIAVQQAAAGSREFYQQGADAVVNLVGLDRGLVLLFESNGWHVAARSGQPGPESQAEFSRRVVQAVLAERRTFYEVFGGRRDMSLAHIDSVVASPIFGPDEAIIGLVYGANSGSALLDRPALGPLEAQGVQLLATTIGVGLARAHEEAEAARARMRFEQFFSSELAAELERNPTLLEGREREVSLLCLDIRGFSRLSESLGPRDLYRLAEDYMDRFTEQIQRRGGVVVDYAGDGVLAMWNAPTAQPDHADRACGAALDVLATLPELNAKWQEAVGEPLAIGVGINTDTSLVGNAGSRAKLKYGPRGHAVNLASRIEGATKQFGVPILIAGPTREHLREPLFVRRLGQVQLHGMIDAIDLYELVGRHATPDQLQLCNIYERALIQFEQGACRDAADTLRQLQETALGGTDRPTQVLLARATALADEPPATFDSIFRMTSK